VATVSAPVIVALTDDYVAAVADRIVKRWYGELSTGQKKVQREHLLPSLTEALKVAAIDTGQGYIDSRDVHPAEVVAAAQDATLTQILEDVAEGNELRCALCDRVFDPDNDVLVTAIVGNAVRPICRRCDAMEAD
jgi:CBS domain-containing protein